MTHKGTDKGMEKHAEKATDKATEKHVSITETVKIPKKTIKFYDFMKSHLTKKDSENGPTNTRIGDQDSGIFGGSYHIPDDDYSDFLSLYFQEVFVHKKKEYLTEKQLDKNGPILIDIDLRFELDMQTRCYTSDHIEDLVDQYLEELKNMYQFDDETKFSVFIFEKSSMNPVPEKKLTKDGIHIIFGIQSDPVTQQLLRKRMIKRIDEIWGDFPIINTWEDALDSGISTGKVNWQMYGSQKPNYEPYSLTQIYEITFDSSDEECIRKTISLDKFNLKTNFAKLSARYSQHPSYFYKSEFIASREAAINSGDVVCDGGSKRVKRAATGPGMNNLLCGNNNQVLSIKNAAELKEALAQFLDGIIKSSVDYELHEAYNYTMTLPQSYYGDGSFLKWIRVGWALRNISDKLFIVWIAFSAQNDKFDFRDIPDYYEKWLGFDMNNPQGLTKRSIMHWSKIDALAKYKKVRENSIDYYIDQTLGLTGGDFDEKRIMKGCGDFDLATVLYHLYKDEYVCVSVKANIWYVYKNHRWEEIDSGTTLRKAISTEMREMYRKKVTNIMVRQTADKTSEKPVSEDVAKFAKAKTDKILEICLRLSRTSDKKNIMTEAKELFYDGAFLQKLDTNPYLLCFNNGVIDFKDKVFRRGYPEDCISKTTNIDYRPVDAIRDKTNIEHINTFMNQLFPVKQLCKYMWEHLASTLIGTSSNQTFNMYIGVGQNGKSVLVSLMEMILGEYKGDVPLSLVTDKRVKIGGLAPEMVALKGIRYACMQEPSKGDRLNEGIMKQITSGIDPIQARAPYMPNAITFIPQFKLVVCSNEFMEIKSQDHGTWRRIRVVDFMSMFVENPVKGEKDKPYQYKLDKNIKEKFSIWKETFMGLLVEKAFETDGNVKDCDIVMKSSNSYRESLDYIAEFIADKVLVDQIGHITKSELTSEFTLWYQGTYGKGGPSPKDVQSYMDKRFGKFEKHKCWQGCRINYDQDNIRLGSTDGDEGDEDGSDDIDVSTL